MVQNAFFSVLTMIIYAVPGYLLIKSGLVKKDSIGAFAMVLTYVCQPCLTLYAFDGVEVNAETFGQMGIFFLLITSVLGIMLAAAYLVWRKKQDAPRYRIATIACAFGNFTFMGIPVLEALMPDFPEAKIFATMGFLSMNLLSWTVGSAIITKDARYCRLSKIFLNPGTIAFAVSVALVLLRVRLPEAVESSVVAMGRMSAPICMIILGMRLATVPFLKLFSSPLVYLSVGIKQIAMPLIAFAICFFLPVPQEMKTCFYVVCCMPVASNVLNFAEMLGDGREEAANTVLFGTVLSVLTIPIMMLIV